MRLYKYPMLHFIKLNNEYDEVINKSFLIKDSIEIKGNILSIDKKEVIKFLYSEILTAGQTEFEKTNFDLKFKEFELKFEEFERPLKERARKKAIDLENKNEHKHKQSKSVFNYYFSYLKDKSLEEGSATCIYNEIIWKDIIQKYENYTEKYEKENYIKRKIKELEKRYLKKGIK